MEQENSNEISRGISSFLSLYSIPIYALFFTVVLYIVKSLTSLHIEVDSFFSAFIFVAVVLMLNPLSLFIEIGFFLISEKIKIIPSSFFRLVSRILELLFLVWMMGRIDGAIDLVELSLYAQMIFAFIIFVIINWITGSIFDRKASKE